jgi:hypothetical protein
MAGRTYSGILDSRLRSVEARGRIADALLGVALDVVEPFATEYLAPIEYDHLCHLLQDPIRAATEAALTTIEAELARVIDSDEPIARRLQRAHGRRS